jgi:hypothetical protein
MADFAIRIYVQAIRHVDIHDSERMPFSRVRMSCEYEVDTGKGVLTRFEDKCRRRFSPTNLRRVSLPFAEHASRFCTSVSVNN